MRGVGEEIHPKDLPATDWDWIIYPLNPTFGDVPKIFLDTDTRINDLISKIKTSDFARSFFITGVRGSGKTVF